MNLHERVAPQIQRRQTRKPKAGPPLLSLFGLRTVPASRNVRFGTNLPIVSFEPKGQFTLGNVSKLLADGLKTASEAKRHRPDGVGKEAILAHNAYFDKVGLRGAKGGERPQAPRSERLRFTSHRTLEAAREPTRRPIQHPEKRLFRDPSDD
mgnify:FL=1